LSSPLPSLPSTLFLARSSPSPAMCNLFLSLRPPTGRHSLILLSNRDEVLARPTAEADWRDGILAGIDLQIPLKGTWFCINKQGKIGLLLAITQLPEHRRPDAKSRGRIAPDFLLSPMEGKEYCDSLKSTADEYDGFTFVAIDRPSGEYEMHSFTNAHVDELETKEWPKAAHVVGNCPPHTTYKKMERGRELLDEVLNGIVEETTSEEIAESLFAMGQDRVQCYPDAQLDSQVS
ncbi:hypothetical protein PMAYCL1PPCAC_03140, partial [Pristionchus mayeri]